MSSRRAVSTRPPLMQLVTDLTREGEEASAGLVVRWDAPEALRSELERRDFKHPYVVLAVCSPYVVHPSYSEDDDDGWTDYTVTRTYVRPLDDGAWYVNFSRAGINEVRAFVVDARDFDERRKLYKLAREGARVDSDGDLCYTGLRTINTSAVLSVDVPAAMFAKEPPRWLKAFVGNFFESPAFDECHFRKRVLISTLLIAPFMLTFGLLFRILVLAATLVLGLREIQWSGLKPFNMSETPWPSGDLSSVYLHTAQGYRRPLWFASMLLHPLVLTVPAGLIYLLVRANHGQASLWEVLAIVDGVILAGATLSVVLTLIAGVIAHGWNSVMNAPERQERLRLAHEQHITQERAAYFTRLSELSAGTAQSGSASAAPVNLTVKLHLKWTALKAQVCKPLQR